MTAFLTRFGAVAALAVAASVLPARADEPVQLTESWREGRLYRISTRVDLSGVLTPPADKSQPTPKPVSVQGDSAIDYDERLLTIDNGEVRKTIRRYARMEFHKTLADRPSEGTLRPEVRRLVVMREKGTKAPFSPDGPLTWGEIDLVRTDVFTPALAGMLPDHPVRVGDRWNASSDAVRELTDMEHIDDAAIECRLEETATTDGRRQARVSFRGVIHGGDEDGADRQQLDGWYLFDLESNYLSYVYLKGVHSPLDKDGKEMGRIEGRYVLSRKADTASADLSDDALKGATLTPNADDTRLLYDNPDFGVRFLYPRRWHVAAVHGGQVAMDAADGSGLLITLDAAARTPTGAQFLDESRSWLEGRKVKVLRVEAPATVASGLEHFALETEAADQKALMDYYVARQTNGGATLAARLPADDDLGALRKEVEGIARSLAITKKIEDRK